jgi:hypothetical protein
MYGLRSIYYHPIIFMQLHPVCDGRLLSQKSSSYINHIASFDLHQTHTACCKEPNGLCSASSAAANEHVGTEAPIVDDL